MDEEDLLMNYGAEDLSSYKETEIPNRNRQERDPTELDTSNIDPTAIDPTAISTKPRRTQVRLTAEKLLSDKGLPFVIKYAPKRIRISTSKKSAYQNLSSITQFYQLWAHNLFPKAKFVDFIKLCHSLGKNDKTLREYRVQLFRDEMLGRPAGGMGINVPPNNISTTPGGDVMRAGLTDTGTAESHDRDLFVSENDNDDATVPARSFDGNKDAKNIPESDDHNHGQSDSDDDLYSLSSTIHTNSETQTSAQRSKANSSTEKQNVSSSQNISPEDELDTLNELEAQLMIQRQGANTDVFGEEEEDEDAIEVMKELGF